MLEKTVEETNENIWIKIDELTRLMACSHRHIYRMEEEKKMPAKIKFGKLVRWRRSEIMAWINADCPAQEPTKIKENTSG